MISINKDSPYYRQCRCCGKEFMAMHQNRQFCPDKKCHDNFNNQKKQPMMKDYWEVIKKLNKNNKILEKFYKTSKKELTAEELKSHGYQMDLYLSTAIDKQGFNAFLQLKYGLVSLINNNYKIIIHGNEF